jgi:predicted RecA/RadA family phage recombinase
MDYTPAGGHPAALSFTAAVAISGGQLVALTGPDEVSPGTVATAAAYVGVAGSDAAVGERVTILCGSGVIHETAKTAAAIAPGAEVTPGAGGVVLAGAAPAVGMAIRDAAAGVANQVRWLAYR